ncbi:MAG: leucine-rich repeat domain-containing protein [Pseudoflavonifractor sp.]|nr:leucine-rich repeat domain-containing protein [Pseudoflavonifractor sp.]
MRLFYLLSRAVMVTLLTLCSLQASAFKITIDGIIYSCNKDNKRASVQGAEKTTIKKVNIPDEILHTSGSYKITSIANEAFMLCDQLTTVTLGNNIETIGTNAFYGIPLKTVKFPDKLRIIGQSAFADTPITSASLPASLEIIRLNAFLDCTSLTSVKFSGNKLTELGVSAFEGCTALRSVNIPSSLTTIPDNAFSGCPIANLSIPSSVTTIGQGAFSSNETPSLVIPASVTAIGKSAFAGSKCTTLSIPASLTALPDYAFFNCVNLTHATIPSSVRAIGTFAFGNCFAMATVTIPPTIATITEYAFHQSGLTTLTIPQGVTTIGQNAFYGCSKLTSVTFPSSLKAIGNLAFDKCPALATINFAEGLETIGEYCFTTDAKIQLNLPASLKSIGIHGFAGCHNVTAVNSAATTPPVCGNAAFYVNSYSNTPLTVPDGSVDAYREATEWKKFTHINDHSAISSIEVNEPFSLIYYDFDGIPVDTPVKGRPYIVVKQYTSGRTVTDKVIF